MAIKPITQPGESGSHDKPDRDNPSLPAGTILNDRFVLTELLATGGTSYIYRARDLLTVNIQGADVNDLVIKITKHYTGKTLTSDLLSFNEALITRKLTHPNIVRVYDFDNHDAYNFITMEYLSGESLAARLSRTYANKLPYKHAMNIVHPVARAIQYANEHGITHSDIKPGNIIICADNTIKVIDFGTARKNKNELDENQNDHTGYTGYTPAYASPQILLGNMAMTSDDVYSLAFTVYETLSGLRPYNTTRDNVKHSHKINRIKGINFFQWLVLKKALSFDENRRYQSVRQFMQHFMWSRHVWKGVALVSLFAGLISFGSSNMGEYYNTYTTANGKLQTPLEITTQIVKQIRSKKPLERYKALTTLNKLPNVYKQAAYGMLAEDVITPISLYVEKQIFKQSRIPDFDNVSRIIDATMVHYPDSAKLAKTKRLVNNEKNEFQETLLLQYQDQWENTSFTSKEAYALLETIDQLKTLSLEIPSPDKKIHKRYIKQLHTSIKQYDFLRIEQLDTFQKALPVIRPEYTGELIHIFQSANVLAQYARTDPAIKPKYPTVAADIFWSSFFASYNKNIKGAWKDKKLATLKIQLDTVRKKIPDSYPPLVAARNKLAELLRSKARYYKRKRIFKHKIKQFNSTAAELTINTNGYM